MAAREHIVIPRLPALDGLRGVAVLGVLFFHADNALPGGYLGVDLFFVLSGFLITSILVAEQRERGRIDLYAFWIRRARRLFPALLALIPAVAIYAAVFAKQDELAGLRADAIATLAYVANWHSIFARHSYWELFAAPSPLEHTWSLAIEEQFYVLWPLLVVAVYKLAPRGTRALALLSGALAIASAVTMACLFSPDDTTRAYLGTDARGGAILAGAILALVLSSRKGPIKAVRALDALGFVAAVGLATAWARLDGQSAFLYRGGFWLTELGCVVLIACAAQGSASLVARALSFRPLMLVGAISYGVYLWHWPLYVVLTAERTHLSGAWLTLLRMGATFAVAIVSYRLLEQPIRHRGVFFGRAALVVPAAIGIDLVAILWATRDRPGPLLAAALPATTLTTAGFPDASTDGAAPMVWDLPAASELPPGTLRVLVVGDSVAMSLGNLLRVEQATSGAFVAQRAVGDCSILEGIVPTRTISKQEHAGGDCSAAWARDTAELRPDVTLVLFGGGFFASAKVNGKWVAPCDPAWHDVYVKRLQAILSGLLVSGGRPVLVLPPYPVGKWKYLSPKVDCYDAALSEAAAAVVGVTTLDLQAHLCPGGECALESDGAPIRIDGLHFEYPGGSALAQWVLAELQARPRL